MRSDGWIVILAMLLASCTHMSPERASSAAAPDHASLAFVEAACGGCHAVKGEAISPNPLSPAFAAIANRDGLTRESLASWLRDAHNYPEEMDFGLSSGQIEMIADHMLTLRSAEYKRLPD